jgi:hypothetical protein
MDGNLLHKLSGGKVEGAAGEELKLRAERNYISSDKGMEKAFLPVTICHRENVMQSKTCKMYPACFLILFIVCLFVWLSMRAFFLRVLSLLFVHFLSAHSIYTSRLCTPLHVN